MDRVDEFDAIGVLLLQFAKEPIMPDHPSKRSDQNSPKKEPAGGTTRRTFLKSAGLAPAMVAGLDVLHEVTYAQAEPGRVRAVGPEKVPIKLRINGQVHAVEIEPRATLAEVLRDDLHLTGTKVVCDRGACSACTVMLDKTLVCSCMTLAIDVGQRNIRTIEGLAEADNMHPVQAAFVAHDALQCGFCTSGMVMSCAALLERNPSPTAIDVKTAISGNICRCGTYPKVFEAVLAGSQSKGT
jgi:xanthine dehydrogenase YagT iron-sulfur-binding subunit